MIAANVAVGSRVRSSAFALDGGDALALLVPAAYFMQAHFVGELYAPEIFLAALLPPLAFGRVRANRVFVEWPFVVLCLVWLYGQIATDVYRGTTLHNLARGWANIIFTLIDFTAIALLLDARAKRYVLFAIGFVVGLLLDFVINRNDLGYPWKFGVAVPISLTLVLIACTGRVRRVPFMASLVVGAAAVLNLLRDYRSLALILFVAALYLAFADRRHARSEGSVKTLFRLALVTSLGVLVFSSAYSYAAGSGHLGATAEQKYLIESRSPYGLIGGGRPEFFASLHAIADSPLLGHGSWPVDPTYLKYLDQATTRTLNVTNKPGLIPSHSHLTGAWVSAGILGLPVWIWALFMAGKALARGLRTNDQLLPLVAFAAMWLGWAIPFSPYAGPNRISDLFYVLLLVLGIDRSERTERGL
jgi:FtsH-binding integral membrane protein